MENYVMDEFDGQLLTYGVRNDEGTKAMTVSYCAVDLPDYNMKEGDVYNVVLHSGPAVRGCKDCDHIDVPCEPYEYVKPFPSRRRIRTHERFIDVSWAGDDAIWELLLRYMEE